MERDENSVKPPPLPPSDGRRSRQKPRFWRTPIGVIAAIGLAFGAVIMVAVIGYSVALGTGMVPDTAAVAGGDLPGDVVALLQEHAIVEDDEPVRYYYSAGLFDHLADGHLISDTRIVWFWRTDGEIEHYWLEYPQVADLQVAWGEGMLDDTIITVVDKDDDEMEIYVSTESGGDRLYYERLRKLWQEHR